MTPAQRERIDSALLTLISRFIPDAPPTASPSTQLATEELQDTLFDRASHTLFSTPHPDTVIDVHHIGDLIASTLPEPSIPPFNALFSRLLTQPVLDKKWAILKLLHELRDDDDVDDYDDGMELDAASGGETTLEDDEIGEEELRKAFGYQGLHRMAGGEGAPEEEVDTRDAESGLRTKAEILGRVMSPSDDALLAALPYSLLGLSSTPLPVVRKKGGGWAMRLPETVPLPVVSLLHALAEPSLLYRTLDEFVKESPEGGAGGGLVGQSLRAAVGLELRGYVNLVGGLESEIRRAVAAVEGGSKVSGVTLKRCVVWTREATMGLRLMSLIVDKVKGQKGGQLISTIHAFATSHGDPFVYSFAERLLTHITRPFYDMLRHWIYEGELTDPYLEFFVTENDTSVMPPGPSRGGASSVWEDKYTFFSEQVPTIITTSFANRVFLIGKSLNFIRHGCSDSDWVEAYSKSTSKELRYGDTAKLEMNIDEAYSTTMARLIDLMGNRFKLFDHLRALKKFLLLGQGDFIALLMESLSDNLDRPAGSVYRHNLTAQLEHAIRGSNAQFDDPEVLRRLDARMLELSHGEVGWDAFTLEYKIDAPVDVVVTQYGSRQYLKVFNFLWRIKRVEYALGSCWRRFMTGARGVLRQVEDLVGDDWKRTRCVVAEMVHFVNQLQYYILFEVIESSWDTLQTAITKPGVTLDDLIEAHAGYLENITHKGLLGSPSTRTGKKRSAAAAEEDTFLSQLHEILKIMLLYKDAVDGLYRASVAEAARREEMAATVKARTERGEWGVREADDELNGRRADSDPTLPNLRARLQDLSTSFTGRVVLLLGDLAYQPDTDLRLLGVLLSFNEFYPVVNKRRARESRRTPRTVVKPTADKPAQGGGAVAVGKNESVAQKMER